MKSTEVNFEILCFSMWFILECECPTHAFARLNKTCHNAESLEFMVVQLSWISLETTKFYIPSKLYKSSTFHVLLLVDKWAFDKITICYPRKLATKNYSNDSVVFWYFESFLSLQPILFFISCRPFNVHMSKLMLLL